MAFNKEHDLRTTEGQKNMKRLVNELMIRRTNNDTLLGQAILNLPAAHASNVLICLDDLHQLIYNRLVLRMGEQVALFIKEQDSEAVNDCSELVDETTSPIPSNLVIDVATVSDPQTPPQTHLEEIPLFTDVMRLRQFVSHPCLIQSTLAQYLTDKDKLEILQAAELRDKIPQYPKIVNMRNELHAIDLRSKSQQENDDQSSAVEGDVLHWDYDHATAHVDTVATWDHDDFEAIGGSHGFEYSYKSYIESFAPSDPVCIFCSEITVEKKAFVCGHQTHWKCFFFEKRKPDCPSPMLCKACDV